MLAILPNSIYHSEQDRENVEVMGGEKKEKKRKGKTSLWEGEKCKESQESEICKREQVNDNKWRRERKKERNVKKRERNEEKR